MPKHPDLKKLLAKMSNKEKIAQLMQLGSSFFSKDASEITGPMSQFGLKEDDLAIIGSNLGVWTADTAVKIQKKIHGKQSPRYSHDIYERCNSRFQYSISHSSGTCLQL